LRLSKNIICCLLVLALNVSLLSGCSQSKAQLNSGKLPLPDSVYDALIKSHYDFYETASNQRFSLLINGSTAEIKVVEKQSGISWFSNPQERLTYDDIASGVGRDKLSSQIDLEYNVKDSAQVYNSFTDAIQKNQFSFEETENGIRVNYLFGEKPVSYLVPQVLSVERFESLKSGMDASGQETLERYYQLHTLKNLNAADKALLANQYPALNKYDCYIVMITSAVGDPNKIYAGEYVMQTIHDAFTSGGYTKEDFRADNDANSVTVDEDPDYSIAVSLCYTLEEESLSVKIPPEGIVFDREKLELTGLSLLPMFGAADAETNGTIFVPDGSGALINLNNGKTDKPSYYRRIYGEDTAIFNKTASGLNPSPVRMPIYGMNTGNSAFLAVIESLDSTAFLCADVSGKTNKYNTVYPVFQMSSFAQSTAVTLGINEGLKYQKHPLTKGAEVRYLLMSGDLSASDMAQAYRRYLTQKGLLPEEKQNKEPTSFAFTTVGAVTVKKAVMGIPIETELALTTYAQHTELLNLLHKNGIDNITMQLDGWCNKGIKNTAFNRLEPIGALGGKRDLIQLIDSVKDTNTTAFFGTDFQYVSKTNGFSVNRDAARNLENLTARTYDYELSTLKWMPSTGRMIVSPRLYDTFASAFRKSAKSLGIQGVGLQRMGHELGGDYNESQQLDRDMVKDVVARQSVDFKADGFNVAVNGGNIYALKGTDFIFDAPDDHGGDYIFDSRVPFYQMVLHGVIEYTGSALNMSSDFDTALLRAAETGSIPMFRWIWADNETLKETEYNYYSISYRSWTARATEAYRRLNPLIKQCADAFITDYKTVSENVFQTEYSNGARVYVNYGAEPLEVEGQLLNGRDFLLLTH